MGLALHDRLLRRELGGNVGPSKVQNLYGNPKWVHDLDIVNELDGHDGCVNALSWSRSGNLLASGSDDTRIHIHSYLPQNSVSQFNLTTSIFTGHTQNIFSVKFMPHSNDRTIVSAAGDATVRIFDVEYSGHSARRQAASEAGLTSSVFAHTSRLNEGDTNAKVFRSHSDRVKRIVTESSPFYFLTCSEDGEVRQWDVREPESTYPGSARQYFHRPASNVNDAAVPPPLITYKRYQIDLNTISCSSNRPHYIALGGNHLHCFLHDRRMLGRDRHAEQGRPAPSKSQSLRDEEEMAQATQCVRRFAPHGQSRMGRSDSGHITACKISDADPNELIVSWSGDHIYSFNINEASPAPPTKQYLSTKDRASNGRPSGKAAEPGDRKRKRLHRSSEMSVDATEHDSTRQRTSSGTPPPKDLSLRVNYGNGQREEIPLSTTSDATANATPDHASPLPEFMEQSDRIARDVVAMRKFLFSPGQNTSGKRDDRTPNRSLTWYTVHMTSALNKACIALLEIEDVIVSWRYPVNPSAADVAFQKKLRKDRESAARFVQATGVLSRVLGGQVRTVGGPNANAAKLAKFIEIRPALNESSIESRRELFGYDFLRAICMWLDSGPGGLVRGFTRRASGRSSRYPITPDPGYDEASIDAIDDQLIPYLLALADPLKPVIDIETSPFEVDENRVIFPNERAAVLAFAQAVKIPFEDLSTGAIIPAAATSADRAAAQDRQAALRFWGFKVGRGVLIEAAAGVNFNLVDTAFGGVGRTPQSIRKVERDLARLVTHISGEEEDGDEEIQDATLVSRTRSDAAAQVDERVESSGDSSLSESEIELPLSFLAGLAGEGHEEDGERLEIDLDNEFMNIEDATEDEEDLDMELEAEHDEGSSEHGGSEPESEDDSDSGPRHILFSSGRLKSMHRSKVNAQVPFSTHTRHYEGHCNVKTVKDVNLFGLQDEYIVSGSDCGHVFMWDRKTTELVNILEGDGEVVNVVQGHPYEPMLAVSGIDHTVKIFSPDARARRDARLGVGVRKADESEFSSIQGFGLGRRRRRARAADPGPVAAPADDDDDNADAEVQARAEHVERAAQYMDTDSEDEDGRGGGPGVAEGGLRSRKSMWDEYRIRSANESERRGNSSQRGNYVSRSMMQMLLSRLREQMAEEGDGDGGGDGEAEGGQRTLVINDERCATM